MTANSTEFYEKAPPQRGASSFIYPPTESNLRFFADGLRSGCVVAIPTETVYGLAALALNPEFCREIFTIKGRPLMDPLIVHVSSVEMASDLADLPASFPAIAEAFWPGPLTVIVNKKPCVPDLITAGKATVAIRMPRHPASQSLIRILGEPLAAPSANPFGYVSPSRPEHVAHSFGAKVPFIIDGGPCEIGLESTILDLSEERAPRILRPGNIAAEEISAILNCPVDDRRIVSDMENSAMAPGTMSRHYSPASSLVLFEKDLPNPHSKEAVIRLRRPAEDLADKDNIFWFSETGEPSEIARSLFDLLRKIDARGYTKVHCEVPEKSSSGILHAIRDRLIRASSSK